MASRDPCQTLKQAGRSLLLTFLLSPTWAEPPPPDPAPPDIRAGVSLPFAPSAEKDRHYLPVSVTLTNRGAPGTVRVEAFGDPRERVRRTVFLGEGASKLISLCVSVPALAESLSLEIHRETGNARWPSKLDFPPRRSHTVPVVSRAPIQFRSEKTKEFLYGSAQHTSELRPTNVKELPPFWRGYDSVADVVLNGRPEMTRRQERALARWVGSGGNLVIYAGWDWLRHQGPLDDLLPVTDRKNTAYEIGQISWRRLYVGMTREMGREHDQRVGITRFGSQGTPFVPEIALPLHIHSGALHARSTVFCPPGVSTLFDGLQSMPLASIRWVGDGAVVFFAFDLTAPPFGARTERAEILFNVLKSIRLMREWRGRAELPSLQKPAALDEALVQFATEFRSIRVPTFRSILIWLLIYLVFVGPLDFLLSRLFRRRAISWLTFPTFAILFTLVAYGWAYHVKGQDTLVSQWTFVRSGEGEGTRSARTFLGLFSPTRRTYDVRFSDQDLEVDTDAPPAQLDPGAPRIVIQLPTADLRTKRSVPLGATRRAFPLVLERSGDGCVVRQWPAFQWDVGMLRACWQPEGPVLEGKVTIEGAGLVVDVRNLSILNVVDSFLLTSAWVARLGPAPPGSSIRRALGAADLHGPLNVAVDRLSAHLPAEKAFLKRLLAGSIRAHANGVYDWERPLLLACAEGTLLPATVLDAPIARHSAYTVIEAPCEVQFPMPASRIPPGFCARRVLAATGLRKRQAPRAMGRGPAKSVDKLAELRTQVVQHSARARTVLELQTPPEAQGRKLRSLRIRYRYTIKEVPKLFVTDLIFGLEVQKRGSLVIRLWDYQGGAWQAQPRDPIWAGEPLGRQPIKHEGATFPNTEAGLELLKSVLLRRARPDPQDSVPRPGEFVPKAKEFDEPRKRREPMPETHEDLLSKAEIEGTEYDQEIGPLLVQFHCLPLREGPYQGSIAVDVPNSFVNADGRIFLSFSSLVAVDVEALNAELELEIKK